MKPLSNFNFDDSPARADHLGFEEPARNLARQLCASKLPIVLGLFGRWGSGKSTFLNLVTRSLEAMRHRHGPFAIVRFEPWKLEGSDSILYDLVCAIHQSLSASVEINREQDEAAKTLFGYLEDLGIHSFRDLATSSLESLANNQLGLGKQARFIMGRLSNARPEVIAQARIEAAVSLPTAFRSYLQAFPVVPAIVIDDLDRCRPNTVVALLKPSSCFSRTRIQRSSTCWR